MTLKAWIDEIKTAESVGKSEAQLAQASAPGTGTPIIRCADYPLPGEKQADEIIFGARDEIVAGGVFHFTPQTDAVELEINRTFKAILAGGSDFNSLRAACARWVEEVKR